MRLWTLLYSGIAAIGLVIYAWWTATQDPRGCGLESDFNDDDSAPHYRSAVGRAMVLCDGMGRSRITFPGPLRMGSFLVTLNILCGLVFTCFGVLAVIEDFRALFQ